MSNIKEKILKSCNCIPVVSLTNYINKGYVTLQELVDAGLKPEKVEKLQAKVNEIENNSWTAACKNDTIVSYNSYIKQYPGGKYVSEAKTRLNEMDDNYWRSNCNNLSVDFLNSYQTNFPDGRHIQECISALKDADWLKAKGRDTVEAYQNYIDNNPSSEHIKDARERINSLNDDTDWDTACHYNQNEYYHRYIKDHPCGKYVAEAQKRIQLRAGKEIVLNALKEDPNAYGAAEIKQEVENGRLSWDDLHEVFNDGQVEAIQNFKDPSRLPQTLPPTELQSDTTEVFFWGAPGSGKTCALGSLISYLNNSGALDPLNCNGYDYMNHLINLFNDSGYCILPDSTAFSNIQEMVMNIRDGNGYLHKVSLIDLAGELFLTSYSLRHNLFVSDSQKQTLRTALNYLRDQRNEKIQFFVIPYGEANERTNGGLKMGTYLDDMTNFLQENKIFNKTTVGVYVLVTKCDKISCDANERPKKAKEYIENTFPSFWNKLNDICDKSGIKDVKVLSYSIGDVFAKNFCSFNENDMQKVKDKLLRKTYGEGSSIWDKFWHLLND